MRKPRILLTALLALLALTSCAGNASFLDPVLSEEERSIQEESAIEEALSYIPTETTVTEVDDLPDIEAEGLEKDRTDTSAIETDPGYVICLQGKDDVIPEAPRAFKPSLTAQKKDFRVEDQNGHEIEVVPAYRDGYPGFTASDGYEGSELYRITLLNEDASFLGKDPTVRELFLNLHESPVEDVHDQQIKDSVTLYDIGAIAEEGDDALGYYFIYPAPVEFREGDIFGMGPGAEHPQGDDGFYGKFIQCSKNPNGDGYLVRYEPADGTEIYDVLNIDQSQQRVDLSGAEPVIDAGALRDFVLDSQQAKAALRYALAKTNTPILDAPKKTIPSGGTWTTRLTLDIDTSYADSTFKIAVTGTLNFQPADHIHIALSFTIALQVTWDVAGSASLEWVLAVPCGISYSIYVERDVTFSIDFKLVVSYTNTPPTEEDIDKVIDDEYGAAQENKQDKKYPIGGGGVSGITGQDKKTLKLFNVDCDYFFPVQIRLEVDLYVVTQLQAALNLGYVTRSKDVVINYSSESSGSDSGSSREESEGSTEWSLTFFGSIYIEAGLEVSLGVGIAGLYKYLHVMVYCDLYLSFTVQGYLRLRMVKTGDTWDGDVSLGGKLEIGWGARLGIELKAFWFDWDHHWPLADVVLWGIGSMNSINKWSATDQTVSLHSNEADLNEADLCRAEVFDGNALSSEVQNFPVETAIHWMYGAFVDEGSYNIPLFELSIADHPEYIDISGNTLTLTEAAPVEFTATLHIAVPGKFGDAGEKDVTLEFKATDVQTVYLDGAVYGRYRDGQALYFPTSPRIRDHKKFVGYVVDGGTAIYQPGDKINVTYTPEDDHRTYITSLWVEYVTYEVYFMDMKGNLLKTETVEKGHAATPPEGDERDALMGENFVFLRWNSDEYLDVQHNLLVYGVYTENAVNTPE